MKRQALVSCWSRPELRVLWGILLVCASCRLGARVGVEAQRVQDRTPPVPADTNCGDPRQSVSQTAYVLPFPSQRSYQLTTPNCAKTHHGRTPFRYAFDFAMPLGDTIIAARGGRVVAVEAENPDGTRLAGDENFVIVRHEDGTYGRYLHLKRSGVLVDSGARVRQSQPIALSGDSGRSTGPHLHFDVAQCEFMHCPTLPVTFANAGVSSGPLEPGRLYPVRTPSR